MLTDAKLYSSLAIILAAPLITGSADGTTTTSADTTAFGAASTSAFSIDNLVVKLTRLWLSGKFKKLSFSKRNCDYCHAAWKKYYKINNKINKNSHNSIIPYSLDLIYALHIFAVWLKLH